MLRLEGFGFSGLGGGLRVSEGFRGEGFRVEG